MLADGAEIKRMLEKEGLFGKEFDFVLLNSCGLKPLEIEKSGLVGSRESFDDALRCYLLGFISILEGIRLSRGATIVYVSSHVLHNREAPLVHSAVSRAAGEMLMDYLPSIMSDKSLRCFSLRFGPVLTARLESLLGKAGKTIDEFESELPRKYCGKVEDLRQLAELLLSESSQMLSNGVINLDCGILAGK